MFVEGVTVEIHLQTNVIIELFFLQFYVFQFLIAPHITYVLKSAKTDSNKTILK